MSGIIFSASTALPRDVDVTVQVSKAQYESATDLSCGVFCTTNATFDPDANRIQYFTTLAAVADVFASSSEAYKAATAWFSQSPRAKTFAVARVFTSATSGYLQCGDIGKTAVNDWKNVTDGAFGVTIDGVSATITSVSFASITELSDIATVIQTKLRSAGSGTGFTGATVSLTNNRIRIVSGSTGDSSTVSLLTAGSTGTDISGVAYLNGALIADSGVQNAHAVPGYVPGTIADELTLIKQAASASGKFLYGWTFDASYRDTSNILNIAAWIEAQSAAIAGFVTNSGMAYDASSITDTGYLLKQAGYHRSFIIYHNNAYYYPEVAILAYALSVNYSLANSTITTKFKVLQGIPTVPVTETQLSVLNNKRINTYTAVGNNAKTFREGVESDTSWYIDDLTNLDNFREELQTAVYNVFLRNKKIPYTANGIALIRAAIWGICDRYVYNGTFADRQLDEAEAQIKGISTDPAFTIEFTPISSMSVSDRGNRIGPPCTVTVNLAGAIHSIDISVEAYN